MISLCLGGPVKLYVLSRTGNSAWASCEADGREITCGLTNFVCADALVGPGHRAQALFGINGLRCGGVGPEIRSVSQCAAPRQPSRSQAHASRYRSCTIVRSQLPIHGLDWKKGTHRSCLWRCYHMRFAEGIYQSGKFYRFGDGCRSNNFRCSDTLERKNGYF
jgi:hypothetical protein